ncbi:hypothetical protein I4U23_010210 [Adineta vaga]|nr:hypothetical protein I4U23_010210 [Adineta vaga]
MAMEYTKANSCELRLDPALESPPLQYVNADIHLNIGETSRRYIIVPPQMPIFQPNQAPPIQSGQVHQHNETPSVQSGQALEQNQAPPMQPDQVHQHNRSQQFPELHLSHIGAAIACVFLGMVIMKILK